MHSSDCALPVRVLTPAILVIGTGIAARSAAVAAGLAGAAVVLLTGQAGNRPPPQLPPRARIQWMDAAAWGAFPGPEIAAVTAEARLLLRPRQLVLAQEPLEARTPLPGWTLPGCTTTGELFNGFATGGGPASGLVLAGNGPFNLHAAASLVLVGHKVVAVVEAAADPTARPGSAMLAASLRRTLAVLRRARVPVLWGTRPIAVVGRGRVEGLRVTGPGGVQTIGAGAVGWHWGFQAETGLARALGVPHRVMAGQLRAAADAEGRTDVPGVFVVDHGHGAQRGQAAGRAAARALGHAAPPRRAGLGLAQRLRHQLEAAFAVAPPDPAALADDTIVCPCEAVYAGAVRRALADGAASLATVKRATRAGMGHCGGRICAATVMRLSGAAEEAGFAAPRVPVFPILASRLLAKHDEPQDAAVARPTPTQWTTLSSPPLQPIPGSAAVVVIGAGIVGLATALYLARDGADVLLIDRGEPGMAASTANAGSLHIQLVPYVYAAGSGGPMADSLPLGPASVTLWRELARDCNEDLGLRTEGGLVLAETAAEMELLRAKTAFERSRGIACDVIGPDDLRQVAPELDGRFAGAAFCPGEGQGDPLRGTMALLALVRRAGVRVTAGVEVTGLEREGQAWCVQTSAGAVRAGHVVNAAGVQAGRIGALAGVPIPVQALVQQVVVSEAAPPMLRQLVAWTGRHLSLKQGDGGHLLIGGGWPGTLDGRGAAHVQRESLEGNVALAAQAMPGLRAVKIVRSWTGLAPTLGRAPVISATPGLPGLWHGVTGNGYTLGPVVGRMLADAVLARRALPVAFSL